MPRVLAAFLGLTAFLAVTVYWLWQMLAGRPGLEPEEIVWRGVLAMAAAGLAGLLLGRLGVSLLSESLQEAGARRRDREALRNMGCDGAGEGGAGLGGDAAGEPPRRSGK